MQQPAHGGNLAWAAVLAGCPPSAILDFSASISPLGPPNSVRLAIESQLDNLQHYPDPDYRELRLALSHFHQLPIEWILPGNGSAELLTLVGRELAQLAATAIMTPAFGDYYRALAAYNAKVLNFPLISPEQRVPNPDLTTILRTQKPSLPQRSPVLQDLPSLDKSLGEPNVVRKGGNQRSYPTEGNPPAALAPPCDFSVYGPGSSKLRTECGLLLNNPHNPTGMLFSREAILPCLEEFALVVVDEAFMDFLHPDQEQSLIHVVQQYPNLVILRSLTKFYSLPGLRLGYAIAHPDRLRLWQSWRDPWPVNTLAAAAAVAALQDQKFQLLTWTWLPAARNQLFQGLASLPGLQPLHSAANFLLVESQQSILPLQQKLLQNHQIFIRDCLSFAELGDRYFRVAVRTSSDNQRLLAAIAKE